MMNNRTLWRISLGGFLFFWALGLLIGHVLAKQSYERQRLTIAALATEKADGMRRLLEGILQRTYLLAELTIDSATDEVHSFQRVAETLRREALPMTLQLAPRGTVKYSLPPVDNPRSKINLFKRPERREEAELARDSRLTIFSGPLRLTQGTVGFVVRRPIYCSWKPDIFWGFSCIAFSLEDFLRRINIGTLEQAGFSYALYRQRADGKPPVPIAGLKPEALSYPVSAKVELPHSSWTLSLMPSGGWRFGARGVAVVVLAFMAALILTALLRAWLVLAQQKRALENLVDLDPLTNLRNRRSLVSYISRRCAEGRPFALAYIDLDKFKEINDTYGHKSGDEFLKGFVRRTLPCLSGEDVMFRLGGDEFLIVCSHPQSEQRLAAVAEAMRAPLQVGDVYLHCRYSVGVAVYPEDGRLPESLLQCADARMYEDKKRRRAEG